MSVIKERINMAKIAIVLANDFEDSEFVEPYAIARSGA